MKFSSTDEKLVKNSGIFVYARKKCYYLFPLETDIESGTKRREISIVVFDILERWLKGDGFRQLSFPRYFQRIF